jgi:DNA-directed RNA polymerase subunit RPC12/RpoP
MLEEKLMSDLPEYHCPRCGKEFLGLSPRMYRFTCAFCGRRWMIKEETKL